jgi:hypothetical protein
MRRRVVFFEPIPPEEFASFADAQGWEYDGAVEATEDQPEEYVWLLDDGTQVHWINDPGLHLVYALVVGGDTFAPETRIRVAFDGYTIDEAVSRFADAEDWPDRVSALSAVAATAPEEYHQQTFDAISSGLTDENEVVRHKSVLAVFYARWPQFLPLLEKIAADDPYEEARRVAAIAVDALRNPGAYPYPS